LRKPAQPSRRRKPVSHRHPTGHWPLPVRRTPDIPANNPGDSAWTFDDTDPVRYLSV
jgi:hypothetical protein